jgi:penicillin-binding protein 2
MKLFHRRSRRPPVRDIAPDEIFLDSHNIPKFDKDQFEGSIEKPISRRTLVFFEMTLALLLLVFFGRIFFLQILSGEEFHARSEHNRLDGIVLFSQRGPIYDRNDVLLAWNESVGATSTIASSTADVLESFPLRRYDPSPSLSHLLGYVSYPKKDQNGQYFQYTLDGIAGAELEFNSLLAGSQGRKIVEKDALGETISQSTVEAPVDGQPVHLSIDSRLQKALYGYAEDLIHKVGFSGGAGVVIDVHTGELLVSVSIPGYDPNVMTDGSDRSTIQSYLSDPQNVFLNRVISGRYTPGSIIKPFLAVGALQEGIISPDKEIFSSGSISLPNPYDPAHPSVFRDWKALGWLDMRHGIAMSSDVYFYTIGGGFGDQKGLGIDNIDKYVHLFRIGDPTGCNLPGEVGGTIPSIAWKEEHFPGDPWRIGDTYHSSIGQYGFQVTPLQMVRALAAIANGGLLVTPHIDVTDTVQSTGTVPVNPDFLQIVREGMHLGTQIGTAQALNVAYMSFAGKTGTAELGVSKERVNSWVMGFWPYENPRYAFAMVMEHGPVTNLVGSASVMRNFFDWVHQNAPEYMDLLPRS